MPDQGSMRKSKSPSQKEQLTLSYRLIDVTNAAQNSRKNIGQPPDHLKGSGQNVGLPSPFCVCSTLRLSS